MKSWIITWVFRDQYDRMSITAPSRRLALEEFKDMLLLRSPVFQRSVRVTKITSSRRVNARFDAAMQRALVERYGVPV